MQILRYEGIPLEHPDFWVYELDAALWRGVVEGLYGDADMASLPVARWAEAQAPMYSRVLHLVAVDGDRRLGVCAIELPQRDNRHIAYLSVIVDPAYRRRGIGSALLDAAIQFCRGDERTTFQGWTWEPLRPKGPRRLRGTHGDGELDADRDSVAFATRHGFKLMQVDTMSRLVLPEQPELEAQARAAREATSPDYRIVQWMGFPPEWADDLAVLGRAMGADVPTGGADLEEESMDEERLRLLDAARTRVGIERLTTAVLHVPSGRLVAKSSIVRFAAGDEVADQWDTIVLREHRGLGLGWFVKTHNHAALRGRWPEVRRLITGNASENQWMLAINRRLGYEPFAASGWFQRKG